MPASDIQYLECPHCHADVMFRADGICLSCRKNRFDTHGINPHETLLNIDHNHRLPSCCFLCGENTSLKKKLSWSYYTGAQSSWISFILSYVPGSHYRATHQMNMPLCLPCTQSSKQVKPLSALPGLECRLLVHRNFRNAFEKLNGKQRLEWEADIRLGNMPNKSKPNPIKVFLSK
ncbi:MAG: hypothetical protein ACXU7D_01720 [Burkholderiaceae bacterium]